LSLAAFEAFSKNDEQANRDKELWEEVKNHHGRKESRLCRVLSAEMLPQWAQVSDWKGLKSIIEIHSQRTIVASGVVENETRYYISSLAVDAQAFNRLIRAHWNVENQLHWTLDVTFREDQSRKRIRNAAQNFSTIRKMALNLLKTQSEKISVNRKRNKCALSDQYREKTLGI
jgi:predicted transposase YbfD/YdcC